MRPGPSMLRGGCGRVLFSAMRTPLEAPLPECLLVYNYYSCFLSPQAMEGSLRPAASGGTKGLRGDLVFLTSRPKVFRLVRPVPSTPRAAPLGPLTLRACNLPAWTDHHATHSPSALTLRACTLPSLVGHHAMQCTPTPTPTPRACTLPFLAGASLHVLRCRKTTSP